MPLTDQQVRSAKPATRPRRLFDAGGLYLEVAPSGGRWWRFKYRIAGKEKRISLGVYPEVSLKEARLKRDDARKQLALRVDPSAMKKALKASGSTNGVDTFERVSREWLTKHEGDWDDKGARILRRLEIDIFPWLGHLPINNVPAPELLRAIQRSEDRGAIETAHRVRQSCSKIFRYAIATLRADRNPAADIRDALRSSKPKHLAAIIEPDKIAKLLRAIDGYEGSLVTRCALRLAPLVFVRPGELRFAEWAEFDLDEAEWNIPPEKMKMRSAHLVPLSTQSIAILRELRPLTGRGKFVFPSVRKADRPMSNNTVLAALRTMGYATDEMSGHGFRAMARTTLDEVLGIRPDFIEHQLAHQVKDPLGRAYNRTTHIVERRVMMQQWADYLDRIKAPDVAAAKAA